MDMPTCPNCGSALLEHPVTRCLGAWAAKEIMEFQQPFDYWMVDDEYRFERDRWASDKAANKAAKEALLGLSALHEALLTVAGIDNATDDLEVSGLQFNLPPSEVTKGALLTIFEDREIRGTELEREQLVQELGQQTFQYNGTRSAFFEEDQTMEWQQVLKTLDAEGYASAPHLYALTLGKSVQADFYKFRVKPAE